MKLRATKDFRDKEARMNRYKDNEFTTTKERGEFIISQGVAVAVEAPANAVEEPATEGEKTNAAANSRQTKEDKTVKKAK